MLLGASRWLAAIAAAFGGTVRFVFQRRGRPRGARRMVQDGCSSAFPADAVYGSTTCGPRSAQSRCRKAVLAIPTPWSDLPRRRLHGAPAASRHRRAARRLRISFAALPIIVARDTTPCSAGARGGPHRRGARGAPNVIPADRSTSAPPRGPSRRRCATISKRALAAVAQGVAATAAPARSRSTSAPHAHITVPPGRRRLQGARRAGERAPWTTTAADARRDFSNSRPASRR